MSAGTSDLPVAEECAETLRMLGVAVDRVYDVGVAGIHRLLHKRDVFEQHERRDRDRRDGGRARERRRRPGRGRPSIAVPTSVGYGARFGGSRRSLGMLSSCASGVSV